MEHWRMVKRVCSLLNLGSAPNDAPEQHHPRYGTLQKSATGSSSTDKNESSRSSSSGGAASGSGDADLSTLAQQAIYAKRWRNVLPQDSNASYESSIGSGTITGASLDVISELDSAQSPIPIPYARSSNAGLSSQLKAQPARMAVARTWSHRLLQTEVNAVDSSANEFERTDRSNKSGGRKHSNNPANRNSAISSSKGGTAKQSIAAASGGGRSMDTSNSARWPFGVALRTILAEEAECADVTLDGRAARVPRIVERLGSHLVERGLRTEGLFRISGNSRAVDALRNAFVAASSGTGAPVQLEADVHASASLLKAFLRELPGGVVPQRLTRRFVDIQSQNGNANGAGDAVATPTSTTSYLARIRSLLAELPVENGDLLCYAVWLARRVAAFSDVNKMAPSSLGIVFGPTLFDAGEIDMRVIGLINTLTTTLIERADDLFFTADNVSPNNSARKVAPPRPPPPSFTIAPHNDDDEEGDEDEEEERFVSRPAGVAHELRLQLDSPRDTTQNDSHSLSPVFDAAAATVVPAPASATVLSGAAWQGGVSPRSLADDPGRSDSPVNLDSESVSEWSSIAPTPRPLEISRPVQSTISSTVTDLLFGPASSTLHAGNSPLVNTLLELPDDPESSIASTRVDTNNNGKQQLQQAAASAQPTKKSDDGEADAADTVPSATASDFAQAQHRKAVRKKNRDSRPTSGQKHDTSANNNNTLSSSVVAVISQTLADSLAPSSGAGVSNARLRRRSRSPMKQNASTSQNVSNGDRANSNPALNIGSPTSSSNSNKGRKQRSGAGAGGADTTFKTSAQVQSSATATSGASTGISEVATRPSPSPQPQPIRNDFSEATLLAGAEHDDLALEIYRLTTRRRELKAKVEQFELDYLASRGYRPSGAEKQAEPTVRAALHQLNEVNLALKRAQLERKERTREAVAERTAASATNSSITGRSASASRHSPTTQTPAGSATRQSNQIRTRSPSPASTVRAQQPPVLRRPELMQTTGSRDREAADEETKTIEGACRVIQRELERKRTEKGRPYELDRMTFDEVLAEKQSLQRRLIWYEGLHGRPTTAYAKQIMRPIYERYRAVKRLVAALEDPRGREQQRRTPEADADVDGRATLRSTVDVRIPQVPLDTAANDDEFLVTRNESQLNIALQRSGMSRYDLEMELEGLKDEKKKIRVILKAFEDQFLRETGRKVQKDDRQQRATDYARYKQVKMRIYEIERQLGDETVE